MNFDPEKLLFPAGIFIVSTFILLFARSVSFRYLHRWADRTQTEADDIIISSIKSPSFYWCIAVGLYIGLETSGLPLKYVSYINKAVYIVVIFSITLAAANISDTLLKKHLQKLNLSIPSTGMSTGLAFGILKGAIFIIGLLIILSVLGVSIAPLLTALGVGGLAVALALKDTLENLFAGIHILVEKSVRIGDFIKLETGQEGTVEDITWRTTRIKLLQNNMVVIPNSKLSQSVVTNFSLPDRSMAMQMAISVSYSAEPERIESILTDEVKKAAGTVQGLLGAPEPFVRFVPGFGESSLDFTLICYISEVTDRFNVQDELRKRILRRFRQEGIEIPFPQRTVYVREEKT